MVDFEIVAAWPENSKILRVEDCPFCGRNHWHAVRASIYEDIRQAPCLQRHLPKKLRGKALYYRLQHIRGRPEQSAEVIAFPKKHVAVTT